MSGGRLAFSFQVTRSGRCIGTTRDLDLALQVRALIPERARSADMARQSVPYAEESPLVRQTLEFVLSSVEELDSGA